MRRVQGAWVRVAMSVLLVAMISRASAAGTTGSPEVIAGVATPVVLESRPLGTPNGMFSARPSSESASSSPLSALDPRQNDVMRVLLALGIVVGLLLVVRFVLRRSGGLLGGKSRPSGVLQIHGRYPVGRGQSMLLLQVGNRMVLVHQGGGRMQTLTEFTAAEDVADLRTRIESGKGRLGIGLPFKGMLDGEKAKAAGDPDQEDIVDLTGGATADLRRRLLRGRRLA